ncbi:MAG: sulfur carrier protein ThiS [Dehalococcoidia bacterium]
MNAGGLHVISDRRLTGEENLVSALVAAAEGGATAIHLREGDLPARRQYELARALRDRLPAGTLLLVNERLDIAMAAGADGVQLPARGLTVEDARAVAPGLLVGRSVHALDEFAEAPDFFLLGTIFASRSHPGRPPGGPGLIRRARAVSGRPIVAIGGVTADNAATVRLAGADGVAVISAVLGADDPRAAAAAIVAALGGETIRVRLNGRDRELPAGLSVLGLLESLGVDYRIVAVELSGDIVDRARFAETVIPDGATVEIVRMIGGG